MRNGWILLVVLICLEVFSVCSLYVLQQVGWQQRFMTRLQWRNTGLLAAEVRLRAIENGLVSEVPACQIAMTPAPILISKPRDWWRHVSCAGNLATFQYYYVVESIGSDPCATASTDPTEPAGSIDYYRITLAILPQADTDQHWLLQSTVTRRGSMKTACTGQRHAVTLGRQQWQELY